jgi:hypothetical protein
VRRIDSQLPELETEGESKMYYGLGGTILIVLVVLLLLGKL